MRTALAGVLLSLFLLVGPSPSSFAVTPIGALYGASLGCDPNNAGCIAIPLTVSTLCTVSCPQQTSFSFTDASRFWGTTGGVGAGVTSTNGGLSWSALASQPFAAGNREFYAGASDGSVIAIGSPAAVCTVRRSIDNGASWSTVFTNAGGCTSGTLEGQRLFCIGTGACNYVDVTGTRQVLTTSDNGQNWTLTTTANIAPNCSMTNVPWDGSLGIAPSEATGCGGGGIARTALLSGGVWTDSTAWTGTQGDCWEGVNFNGVSYAVCQGAGAAPDGRYTLRTSTGALFKSLDLPGALITSIDAGGIAFSPFTNSLYIVVTMIAGQPGVFVSRDGANTFAQIGTAPAPLRGGNMFYSGGCVYFTTAGAGAPSFTKICP